MLKVGIKSMLLFCLCFSSSMLMGSIYCPPDKILFCDDDIYYLPLTGRATAIGYPTSIIKYSDVSFLDQCRTGYVNRIWYVDINQDGIFQSTEPNCTQKLTLNRIPFQIVITFPTNKTYTCKEEISLDKPSWTSGPCDVMGYNVHDEVYEVVSDACYKIFRKFTVLNWCTYKPGDPNWDGSGIWTYTQIIKVIEKNPPTIKDCLNKIIGVESDCKAPIRLTNSATDDNNCTSQLLTWQIEVDLWGDGTKDYVYGPNEAGPFKLDPVPNGQEISVSLPVRVGIGKHKIYWSVHDQCGNFKTCTTLVETKDLKSPTPYMHGFLTTSFQGDIMRLTIPSNCFNINSFDNCSPASHLKYSFSPNINDTIRTIDCTNTGFQFYTIYVTDESGNNDFVEVFMIAFDNGSCSFSGSFGGRVTEANGKLMNGVEMALKRPDQTGSIVVSDQEGFFNWFDISMYNDYQISPQYEVLQEGRVDVADLKKMQNYFFGLDSLVNFQYVAADVNGDHKIRLNDLELIKSKILTPSKLSEACWIFAVDVDTINNINDLKKIRPVLDIMKFDGSIDFKMVYAGDITGANTIETSNRNSFISELKIEENKGHLVSESNVSCHGIQIELEVDAKLLDKLTIQSPYFSISENSIYKDFLHNTIRFVSTKAFNIEAGKPFLTLLSEDNFEESLCKIGSYSKILLEDYQVVDLHLQKKVNNEHSLIILPNPSNGQFELSSSKARVIKVYDQQGKEVPFSSVGNLVTISSKPGLYFVSLDMGGENVIKKLIVY